MALCVAAVSCKGKLLIPATILYGISSKSSRWGPVLCIRLGESEEKEDLHSEEDKDPAI